MVRAIKPIIIDGGGVLYAYCGECDRNEAGTRPLLGTYQDQDYQNSSRQWGPIELQPGFIVKDRINQIYGISHTAARRLRDGKPAQQHTLNAVPHRVIRDGKPQDNYVRAVEIDADGKTIEAGLVVEPPCFIECHTCHTNNAMPRGSTLKIQPRRG
jgi:hypothetical protein